MDNLSLLATALQDEGVVYYEYLTLSRMPHLLSFLLAILFHCLWYYLTCRWYQDRDLLITIFDIFRMIRHHVTFFIFPTDESFEIVQYLRYSMDSSSTNANPSAAKRRRTDDGPVLHPKRSEPWFQDGNIILEARLTQFK